jgi:protein gp37
MGLETGIEWTNATWNPWHGCHKISAGCKNCYMFTEKRRYGQDPNVVVKSKTTFGAPLRWKEPKLVFTCSWSDFFIEEADEWRQTAYEIMRRTPHTYQVLTKRIERALSLALLEDPLIPNMWLGVSVENRAAKIRIDWLREASVALRFLSIEPLLEDIGELDLRGIHWVIVGGESGRGARSFEIEWARSIISQCKAAGVPCFVKQLGAKPVSLCSSCHEGARGFCRLYGAERRRDGFDGHGQDGLQQIFLKDSKGGNPEEWPADIRVREMPCSNLTCI